MILNPEILNIIVDEAHKNVAAHGGKLIPQRAVRELLQKYSTRKITDDDIYGYEKIEISVDGKFAITCYIYAMQRYSNRHRKDPFPPIT